MAVKSYRELIAWQKGMELVETVYRASVSFPREEIYGLTAQIRRSAVSIPSNIAEGQGRNSTREFRNFLSIAHGSLCEMGDPGTGSPAPGLPQSRYCLATS